MEYIIHLSILVLLYTMLAESLDLLTGHAGLLSVCQAAFFGIGAYCSALAAVLLGGSLWTGVFAGSAIGIVLSLLLALSSLRLRDDYFIIATFGVQIIAFTVFNNWMEVTRGPLGISGIPRPMFWGWPVNSSVRFLVVIGILAAAGHTAVVLITNSPFGRVLHAIREDEKFASAQGKNVFYFKTVTFAFSAVLAGVAGSCYAYYISFIDPGSFTVTDSILVIAIVIIGGAGSTWGPLVGAVALVLLPEAIRFVGLPNSAAGNVRQIIYGGLLIGMMMFRPRGLVGKYALSK